MVKFARHVPDEAERDGAVRGAYRLFRDARERREPLSRAGA